MIRMSLRRSSILGALVAVGALSLAVSASQQAQSGRGRGPEGPPVVEVEKLRDNLYILKGGGGNTAMFVGTNGVVIVDTKIPGWGRPLIDKIKELTNKPVTTLINTHTHFDHVGGNVDFPADIEVVAHENTKKNMDRGIPPKGFEQLAGPDVFKANSGRNIAKKTYKDKLSLGSGPDRVDLYYFGPGHTDGDSWVVFPALRVMHAGDIFAAKGWPLVDTSNGGSAVALPDTLAKAAGSVQNVDSIITGHSTVMTMADLKEYAEFNREFIDAVRAAKKAGKSVDDVASSWKVPGKFVGYEQPAPDRLKANVQAAFDELK